MKKCYVVSLLLVLLFCGCNQPEKDTGIKASIEGTAKQDHAFAGVNYIVENGIVTLTGNAPTEKEKSKIEEKVKNLSGVKEVVNRIVIKPAVVSADHLMKQSVDSILKKYPTVQAFVKDSVIILQGTVDSKKAVKLFNAVRRLNAKDITNELVINDAAEEVDVAR